MLYQLSYSRLPILDFGVRILDSAAETGQSKIQNRKSKMRRWAGEDSNLRRLSRQIYSLVRLTASLPTRVESNCKQEPPEGAEATGEFKMNPGWQCAMNNG